jgi:hypothetical protein
MIRAMGVCRFLPARLKESNAPLELRTENRLCKTSKSVWQRYGNSAAAVRFLVSRTSW